MADEKYAKHEIVPQIIRTPPADIMRVKYNTGVEACLGEDLAPRQVKDQPDIQFKADEHALYTLIMTDPDAPSRKDPSRGEVKHWLVVNIPGNKVSQGDVLAEFIGSGPPLGSGKHRYLFVAYKQTGRIVSEESPVDKYTVDGRFNFKTQAFAEKHHLGDAVAGNFYQAEYDDYVPELHAQFKKPEK